MVINRTYLCVCMSPAIDASASLGRAPKGEGEIFKNVKVVENAGGKTINVARWLAIRGVSRVICTGLLGEDNATLFEKEFAKYGIVDKMMRVKGATRRNEMITFPGGSFKLNQAAFEDVEFDEDRFLTGLIESKNSLVVILSGSLPKCCSDDFYAKAVAAFKAKGAFVVLDASGEAMARALRGGEGRTAKPVDYGRDGVPSPSARPDLIKPNDEECEALIGFVPKTPEEFKKATAMLRGELATAKGELLLGAEHVVISAGGAGAWFDGEFFAAPKVEVVDTTAAGDTLLAEYCWQLREAELANQDMAARFAVAAGSAVCTMPGSNPPPVELVEKMS